MLSHTGVGEGSGPHSEDRVPGPHREGSIGFQEDCFNVLHLFIYWRVYGGEPKRVCTTPVPVWSRMEDSCGNRFSLGTTWGPDMEFRSSGLASTLTREPSGWHSASFLADV